MSNKLEQSPSDLSRNCARSCSAPPIRISAPSPAGSGFDLKGGKYGVTVQGTFGGGSVKLQIRSPDGQTFLSVSSATDFTAAGFAALDLPPGHYALTIVTATAVSAAIVGIPATDPVR